MLAFAEAQENTGRHLLALNTLKRILEDEDGEKESSIDQETRTTVHFIY